MIHDVAIAIRRLQKDGAIKRVMTVDCDLHHGNGTAEIFAADPDVYTFSIHQERNYPFPKPHGSLDINLDDGIEDPAYLAAIEAALDRALGEFFPQLIFYLAGADPYREDQLGGLKLTIAGLMARDELVFRKARERKIPVAVTLAGGYARHVGDTVRIHVNTVRVAREFAEQRG